MGVEFCNLLSGLKRGSSTAVKIYLGSCRLGNSTVGKFSLGKILLKLQLGKRPLGKYLTS